MDSDLLSETGPRTKSTGPSRYPQNFHSGHTTNYHQVLTFLRGHVEVRQLRSAISLGLCALRPQVPCRASWLVTHSLGDPKQGI